MAEFKGAFAAAVTIEMKLTEEEARFLEHIAKWDHEKLATAISSHVGRFPEGALKGCYSLLETSKTLGPILKRFDDGREVMGGHKVAIYKSEATRA